MNKEIVYSNKKYVVIDDQNNISEPKVFTDNTLEILQLENDKEVINKEITKLKEEIKEIESLKIEGKTKKIIRNIIDIVIPFIIYNLLKKHYVIYNFLNPDQIALMISTISACIIYPYCVTRNLEQLKSKEKKQSLDDKVNELTEKENASKKVDNKIKALKEEEIVTRNDYNDFDIINVETKEKIKTKVLRK